jgi:hypothetical protein
MPASTPVRWLVSTLAATLAGYFSWLFVGLAALGVLRLLGLPDDAGVGNELVGVLPHGAAGAAFVVMGNAFAPAPKRTPFLHVVLLVGVLAVLLFLRVLAWPVGWLLVDVGAVVGGGAIAAASLPRQAIT